MSIHFKYIVLSLGIIGIAITGGFSGLHAQSVDDLKSQIQDRSKEVEALEKEIAQYQKQLNEIGEEKSSLQKEVRTVEVSRRKLTTDIQLTENRISAADLNIDKLQLEVQNKEDAITQRMSAIKTTLQRIHELEQNSLVEMVLASRDLSDFWGDVQSLQQFQSGLKQSVEELRSLKAKLQEDKMELENEQESLLALRGKLSDQRAIVNQTLTQKQGELSETETTEAQYQAQLAEKKRLKEQFERELLDLESELQIAIDPTSLPPAGSGILKWPLSNPQVTQYFGNTQFAQSGGYNGKGHNGVDFRASIGTEVHSALAGTIRGVGNTDAVSGCYSYGKWVLVEHNNGLSSLYAHLSLIKAVEGETVSTGEVIGYSGNTGYSTGPHLHFGVYASQGVKIVKLGDVKAITNCADASVPIAPLDGYLNPLDYL